jgi:hypothetical protein
MVARRVGLLKEVHQEWAVITEPSRTCSLVRWTHIHDLPQGCEGAALALGRGRCRPTTRPNTNTKAGDKRGDVTGTSHFMRTFNGSVGQGGKP